MNLILLTTIIRAKKTLIFLIVMAIVISSNASQYFDGGGGNENMTTASNWSDDNTPQTGSGADLHFEYNAVQQNCLFDYTNWNNWRTIYFDSNLSQQFTWRNTGVGINLYGNNNLCVDNNNSYGSKFEMEVSLSNAGSTPIIRSEYSQLVFGNDIHLAASATLHLQGGNNHYIYFDGAIHGSDAGVALDSSDMNVQFANSGNDYGGQTRIDYGTLKCIVDNVIPDTSHLYINDNGVFDKNQKAESVASIAGSGTIILGASGGNLTYVGNASETFSGTITGGCSVVKKGSGTWTLSGNNSDMTGRFIIEGGTLEISANNNLGANPASTDTDYIGLNNWATLKASETFTLDSDKGIELTGNGKINVGETKTVSYAGEITGGNQFSKIGLGTLELGTESDIFASEIYINAGTLWVKRTQPFDGTANPLYLGATSGSDPATIKFGSGSGSDNIEEDISIRAGSSGTKTIVAAGTSDDIEIQGKLILNDALTVSANSGADIELNALDMSGTGNHDLTISGENNVTISGIIEADSGAAEINHSGTGTLIISADNSSALNQMMININSTGKVQVDDSYGLGNDPTADYPNKVNFNASGTLYNSVDITLSNKAGMTIANGVSATFDIGNTTATVDLRINGIISGDGQTVKTGAGALYLLGTNTYKGATTIDDGALRINDDRGLGSVPLSETDNHLTINGGTLLLQTNSTTININRNINLGANHGTLTALSDKTLTITSKIKGTGNLTKAGAGNVMLAGINTYTGKTTIILGALRINSDSGLGTPPATTATDHITLDGGTLYAHSGWSGVLDSKRGIKLGASGGTIQVYNNKTMTYAGIIAGAGNSLTKDGAGTLVLTGTNTYSGTTTVNAGRLIINGNHTGGDTYTVNGGIFGGNGALDAIISVTSDGSLIGGKTGSPGILNLNGGVTLTSGASFKAEISGTVADSGYSQIDVIGSVTLGSADLDITLTYAPTPGAKFILIKNDLSDAVTGRFNGIPEGNIVTATYNSITYEFTVHYAANSNTESKTGGNDVMLCETSMPIPTIFRFK